MNKTNHDRIRDAFDSVKMSGGISECDIIEKYKLRKARVQRNIVTIALVCFVFLGSNIAVYASTGESWIHKLVGKYINGIKYDADENTFKGNGYTITIVNGIEKEDKNSGIYFSECEGVDVVESADGIYLVFGENRINVTTQIDNYKWAAGKIDIGGQIVVYELWDLRDKPDIAGIGRGFMLYDDWKKDASDNYNNMYGGKTEFDIVEGSDIYIAK